MDETDECSSIENFTTSLGIRYTRVCGQIRGYQFGSTEAFSNAFDNGSSIDSNYVDGVSLTHGSPREHIWTFAVAAEEVGDERAEFKCVCSNIDEQGQIPPPPAYVGNDYFCDTGNSSFGGFIFYADNPLWDGAGCGPQSTCCSFNNPPWFYRELPQPTTDDIEIRICTDGQSATNEDVAIEVIQIYIQ
jgi:hypothetical protein